MTRPSGFDDELARWGPEAPTRTVTLAEAQEYCRQFTRRQYENFSVGTLLIPKALRQHFYRIYAYCRWADNLGDETGGGERALALLNWWREQLLLCYDRKARHPVMIALSQTIQQFRIPQTPFLDLIRAFEQDQRVKRYDTYQQLLDYCRCSANPVGRLLLYLFESHGDRQAVLSDDICTALQLANFWQDVARDLDIGRVYLPAEDRRCFGYSDDDLQARRFNDAFQQLMRFEVERARELFHRGLELVKLVPKQVRIDVELFARGGLAVLKKIERENYNVWQRRPTLSKWDKGKLLGSAYWHHWTRR